MTSSTTYISTPDQYEILSLQEALERFPQFKLDRLEYFDAPDVIEAMEVVYLKGNFTLDYTWEESLDFSQESRRFLLVEGDLRIDCYSSFFTAWVTGDIHADGLCIENDLYQCTGTVYAKHYVSLLSEDHDEGWCPGPTLTINTPYIFWN